MAMEVHGLKHVGICMTKRKTEPIKGAGEKPGTHIVQKSNPLVGLWQSDLTLAEFKILDTYLSRIDSHHPERRVVEFEKGELEKLLGVQKINTTDLKARLKHITGSVVEIPDNSIKRGFRLITLFEEAVAEQDDQGFWKIRLECTQKAMRYFFNVESLGYLRYGLHAVTCLRSRYSYILFQYLEKNRHMHLSWKIDVNDLRTILNATEEVYQDFKYFNAKLLKLCHKELNEKTECHFDYEPIKKGRRVSAIRFTLEPIAAEAIEEEIPGQLKLSDIAAYTTANDCNDQLALLSEACKGEFDADAMEQIYEIILTIPENKLPPAVDSEDIEMQRYHYLAEKCAIMNRYKPKNRLAYLLKILKTDVKD